MWEQGCGITSKDGELPALEGFVTDITESHTLSQKLSYQANHDSLTSLLNRRAFEERLQRVISTARVDGSSHALCYLDLDQFKVINDTCGHVAGDRLLRELGELLRRHVRGRDTLARLGGDEFALLIERCTLHQAMRVAEVLRATIERYRFNWDANSYHLGVSIGVAPINAESASVSEVLSAADNACYAAKDRGRNRVHAYRPNDAELLERRGEMQWVARINRALETDRFCLSYQPIVPLA